MNESKDPRNAEELSPDQAAELIGISRPFLRAFMRAGALKFTAVGTHRHIALFDLLEFNERRLAAGEAAAEARRRSPNSMSCDHQTSRSPKIPTRN